jgi:hypothetical protein
MAATDLLSTLEERGITLASNDDRLTAEPASRLTDDDRAAIVRHKPALLETVRARAIGRHRLEAACARHGACLGSALEWYSGDDLEDMADNPGLADLAVADALQQGMISRVAPRIDQGRAKEPQAGPDPLDGLPLLYEDRMFIRARTQGRQDQAALLQGYATRWRSAAAAEPDPRRRANAGRHAANRWLLGKVDR